MFEMDKRLVKDTVVLGDFALSRVLLMNDSRYPWLILVPRCAGVSEVFELTAEQQQQLWHETNTVGQVVKAVFQADKINIATLGNVVKQLHMHIVLRMQGDATWPAPVWGQGVAQPYTAEALAQMRTDLEAALAKLWIISSEVDR
ncbi:MAG: HIT domain-containing protein [Pseudomonas sp.]|jgi:diadenosine tetraphosphate (Ap4A) HIT family hydrolase|nr:HIT domain-containing protein [Pseudomonas sp.]MDD2222757.1 HIT domain-containing protein [Pseudomonas sp.]MDY0415400.1 HIT domain-containing protein [Pseudomonas sp.]NLO53297.1 HIT domain-containing protein [Gammaproteobacteria bacterium]